MDEEIFRTMLKDAASMFTFTNACASKRGVELQGRHLVSITTADGKPLAGKDLCRLQL